MRELSMRELSMHELSMHENSIIELSMHELSMHELSMNEFSDFIHSYPYTSLKHIKYAIYIILFAMAWRLLMKIDESFA
jgi:hypothetical protein